MTEAPLLEIRDLRVSFGPVRALDGVSLDALALIRSLVGSRLRDPRVAVPFGALVVLLLMRSLGRRRRRRQGRLTVDEFVQLVDFVERRLAERT